MHIQFAAGCILTDIHLTISSCDWDLWKYTWKRSFLRLQLLEPPAQHGCQLWWQRKLGIVVKSLLSHFWYTCCDTEPVLVIIHEEPATLQICQYCNCHHHNQQWTIMGIAFKSIETFVQYSPCSAQCSLLLDLCVFIRMQERTLSLHAAAWSPCAINAEITLHAYTHIKRLYVTEFIKSAHKRRLLLATQHDLGWGRFQNCGVLFSLKGKLQNQTLNLLYLFGQFI